MKMTKPAKSFRFDFEEWAKLAEQDPDRFEARRARTLTAAIERVPEDRRLMLERLQWKVDRVRELKHTPLAACVAITDMMWNTFHDLNRSYQWLGEQNRYMVNHEAANPHNATILTFTPRQKQ